MNGARRHLGWPLVAGVLASLVSLVLSSAPASIALGSPGWRRAVLGANDGTIRGDVIVTLPGVDRRQARELLIRSDGASLALGVSVRGQPVQWLRFVGAGAGLIRVPKSAEPGLRVRLLPVQNEPPARVAEIELRSGPPRLGRVLAVGALAAGLALGSAFLAPALAVPLALWSAGMASLLSTPIIEFWLAPRLESWRLVLPLLLAVAGLAAARRAGRLGRMLLPAMLVAGFALGLVLRVALLPATGGSDTDYWKAWAQRAEEQGITRVYGDAEAVPPGSFIAQLTGREPAWQVERFGRSFTVDYPPGIMAAWVVGWRLVQLLAPPLGDAAWNVAVKLPTAAGDLVAVLLLVGIHRAQPRVAWTLGVVYWCAPPSWLGGSLLGFVDGAYAPVAAVALVAAAAGRAAWAGGLLAVATLLNLTSLLAAPAAIVALMAARASLGRAACGGLLVGGVALIPFALAGTLDTTLVHVLRVLVVERLSGGFANVWWVVGHVSSVMKDPARDLTSAVRYVSLDEVTLPVRLLGIGGLVVVIGYLCAQLRKVGGIRPTLMVAGLTAFGYGMLTTGVHQSHPFPMLLWLLAAGLPSLSGRIAWALLATTYTLNLVALEGLGRFYDLRYVAFEPVIEAMQGLRMAPGFDITLALAVVNICVFAWVLLALPGEMERDSVRLPQPTGFGGEE